MTRYVIGPDVALALANDEAVIRGDHQILAPALLRSQLLSLLYQAVRRGEMRKKDAELGFFGQGREPVQRGAQALGRGRPGPR